MPAGRRSSSCGDEEEEANQYVATMASEEEEEEEGSCYSAYFDESDYNSDADEPYFPAEGSSSGAGLSSADMSKLQGKLQVGNQSLGPSMHAGDDEGREPAAAAAAARHARRKKRQRQQDGEDGEEEEDAAGRHIRSSSSSSDNDGGDDDECRRRRSPPGSQKQQQQLQPRAKQRCWLCTFANCKMAKQVSVFVTANAGTMDPAIMADQIKKEVLREYPLAKGIGRRHILRHIREHVLIPGVRMASIVRSLITLAETLRCTLQQVDEETGDLVVDIRNTELYLKVVTQISNVYKMDGSKLLFQNGVFAQQQPLQQQAGSSSSGSRGVSSRQG